MKNKEKGGWLSYEDALSFKLAISIFMLIRTNGMTVDAFLKKWGFSKRTFYRILKGGNPKFHTLCSIAKALNVELDDLLNFKLDKKIKSSEKLLYYQFFTQVSWKIFYSNYIEKNKVK